MKQRPRIYYTQNQKALMWKRWRKGDSLQQIAPLFDRNHSSVHLILAETGGIKPAQRSRSRLALTLTEREEISRSMASGQSIRSIATLLGRAPSTISREIQMLHEPPSQYGLHRTSWRMANPEAVLRSKGLIASYTVLQTILGTLTLTRNSTGLQQLLERSSRRDAISPSTNTCRFLRAGTGRRLSAPDDPPIVPQWQRGRAKLTMTAAIEISRNQVTHFYSEIKNTSEMLKLMGVLVKQYAGCEKLYLSWDAAS
jgi:DNA-binding CsgD family transcriptional regulator